MQFRRVSCQATVKPSQAHLFATFLPHKNACAQLMIIVTPVHEYMWLLFEADYYCFQ